MIKLSNPVRYKLTASCINSLYTKNISSVNIPEKKFNMKFKRLFIFIETNLNGPLENELNGPLENELF